MKTTKVIHNVSRSLFLVAVLAATQNTRAMDNDNFASAWPITATPYSTNTSNAGATRETGEPYHYGSTNGHSVWWTWTAPTSGPMQVNTTNGSIRTGVAIYTGSSVSALTLVSAARGNHIVDFVAVAGTTHQIAADSLDAGVTGNFTLRLTGSDPSPANDAFASATAIPGNSYNLSFASNAGATKEPGEPAHAGDPGGKSLWWRWTPEQILGAYNQISSQGLDSGGYQSRRFVRGAGVHQPAGRRHEQFLAYPLRALKIYDTRFTI
jgi:hypothetical protein